MPVGPTILWPVKATRSAPRAAMSTGSCGTACEASTTTVAPTAWPRAAISADRVDRAEHVRHVRHGNDLGPLVEQTLGGGLVQVQPPLVGYVEPAQHRAGPLASSCQGTMLEWCSITEMTISSPGRSEAPSVYAHRLSASEAFLVKTISSERWAPMNCASVRPRALERLSRLRAQHVHGAGDVGVVVEVVIFDRLDHDPRLLRGVGAVEVDQRRTADSPLQDREVGADVPRRRRRSAPPRAPTHLPRPRRDLWWPGTPAHR